MCVLCSVAAPSVGKPDIFAFVHFFTTGVEIMFIIFYMCIGGVCWGWGDIVNSVCSFMFTHGHFPYLCSKKRRRRRLWSCFWCPLFVMLEHSMMVELFLICGVSYSWQYVVADFCDIRHQAWRQIGRLCEVPLSSALPSAHQAIQTAFTLWVSVCCVYVLLCVCVCVFLCVCVCVCVYA